MKVTKKTRRFFAFDDFVLLADVARLSSLTRPENQW